MRPRKFGTSTSKGGNEKGFRGFSHTTSLLPGSGRMRKKLLLVILGLLAIGTLKCSPAYVLRAGYEEARILARRQPIERLVQDAGTPEEVRRKLALVQQARTFAQQVLGLETGDSYTTYSHLDEDTLALVVSAAHKDRFRAVTWWFPIVGHVPYKGFFDAEDALREAERLERAGYDTYVRPTAAFSTLGWFNDPLLSTTLELDDVQLVATVIHELTHNTVFVPSQVGFNESFASFVGDRGAILYFCALEGPEGARCRLAQDLWADNLVFGAYLQALVKQLETVYDDPSLSRAAKIQRRESVIAAARARFAKDVRPALRTNAFRGFGSAPIDNARLLGRRLYFDRLDRFDAVLARHDGDLPLTIRTIVAAVGETADPWQALERLAGTD